jgi:integrase
MRKAELAGLCWDKIDFKNGLIHVARCRDRFGLRDSTKTQGSFRYIPMNDACRDALIKLKKESRHEKLVFAYIDGRPIDFVHIAEREFNKAIKVSGVKRIRFHDLRGTFAANICMAPDGDLYALSKILGHTNVDMTVKKYAHLHNNFLKKVSNSVNFKAD